MMNLLTLLRWPNLGIVFLTQYLFHQRLYLPALRHYGLSPAFSFDEFVLLSLTTIALTAGGYILNDILNLEADRINHPNRPLPRGKISLRNAYWMYGALSVAGFASSLYLAFTHGYLHLLFLYPLSLGLLVFYSTYLQGRILWGNLLISLFCAGVPLLIWLAESPALLQLPYEANAVYVNLAKWTYWYAGLAFLSNLFREIVKDIQDVAGDRATGMRTLPVVGGFNRSRKAAWVSAALLLLLISIPYVFIPSKSPLFSVVLFLFAFLPFLAAAILLIPGEKPRRLKLTSLLIKVGMAGGLLALYFV